MVALDQMYTDSSISSSLITSPKHDGSLLLLSWSHRWIDPLSSNTGLRLGDFYLLGTEIVLC